MLLLFVVVNTNDKVSDLEKKWRTKPQAMSTGLQRRKTCKPTILRKRGSGSLGVKGDGVEKAYDVPSECLWPGPRPPSDPNHASSGPGSASGIITPDSWDQYRPANRARSKPLVST